jgi:tetratricopeptide (TPR) repeat protein
LIIAFIYIYFKLTGQKVKKKDLNSMKPQLTKFQIDSVISLYSSGQINEAINQIKLLNNDFPNVPILFNLLGACFKELGQLKNAQQMFRTAFTIEPNYSEAYFNHGVILRSMGQINDSIESYKTAIRLLPNYPNAYNNLGNAYKDIGMISQAIENFEWAVAYKPEFIEALNNLGIALNLSNKPLLAIKHFEKALLIKPDYVEALFNLAIIHKELGNKDNSVALLYKVIELLPGHIDAYRNISRMKTFTRNDPLIVKMEKLYSDKDLNLSDSIGVCFALSKVYEDLDDQKKQFHFLNEGNKKRKKELNYSFNQSLDFHLKINNIFSNNQLPVIKKSLYSETRIKPIFIVGLPRSGTSLVEQILASHNKVFGAGELGTIAEVLGPLINNSENQSSISQDDILSLREQYLSKVSNLQNKCSIITDKMPSNFRYIGYIQLAFPEAKIIHLKRDARATCWSMYKYYFDSSGLGFSYDLKDLVRYYGLYIESMSFWHSLFPNKIFDICYEDLTVNQEGETRKMLEYCELDWDKNCLNFHKNTRAVKTTSAMQVRNKIYQGSSNAWKKHEKYLQILAKGLKQF